MVYLVYIDESGDEKLGIFTALAVPVEKWREAFGKIKQFRRELRQNDNIYITKEFHAWKFVSGRGCISPVHVSKARRREIFKESLSLISGLSGARLFNAVYPPKKAAWGFERLLTRIDRTMKEWNSHAILICDEGKEEDYTRIRRRLGKYNPIPSRYGKWENGKQVKNITIDRIIEDPFFKKSERSYFIQFVDFCAYSLLCKENPRDIENRQYLYNSFELLSAILVKEANRRDAKGIIRVK